LFSKANGLPDPHVLEVKGYWTFCSGSISRFVLQEWVKVF